MVEQMTPCYPKYILKGGAYGRSKPRCDLGPLVGCGWREVLEQGSRSRRAAHHPAIHIPHHLFSPRAGISHPGEHLNAAGLWKESGKGKPRVKTSHFPFREQHSGIWGHLDVLQSSIKDLRWPHSSRSWVGFHPKRALAAHC